MSEHPALSTDISADRFEMARLVLALRAEVARLRQELDEARAERDAATTLRSAFTELEFALREEKHARKINEYGLLAKLRDVEAERDRMRAVYRKAEMLRDRYPQELTPRNSAQELRDLVAAVDAFRSATPDAEPAPGGEQ